MEEVANEKSRIKKGKIEGRKSTLHYRTGSPNDQPVPTNPHPHQRFVLPSRASHASPRSKLFDIKSDYRLAVDPRFGTLRWYAGVFFLVLTNSFAGKRCPNMSWKGARSGFRRFAREGPGPMRRDADRVHVMIDFEEG